MTAVQGKIAVFTRLHESVAAVAVDELKHKHAGVADVQLIVVPESSDVTSTAAAQANGAAFDGVVAFNEEISLLSTELHALIPLIKPGGTLQVFVANANDGNKVRVKMAKSHCIHCPTTIFTVNGVVADLDRDGHDDRRRC